MSLLRPLHTKYVLSLRDDAKQATKLSHWMSTHLRVSGIYWGLSALRLLEPSAQSAAEEAAIVQFVLGCYNADGGFGGSPGHDSHMLYTLSAVQVLCMLNADDKHPDRSKTAAWVAALQQPDGSFVGDRWGEIDTRFSYSALNCLALLGRLDAVDVDAAVAFVLRCQNWDGGFGVSPSAESHAGQIFCCIGALSIANRLDAVDADRVAWWLAERQLPSGGLNGRPEKKADVCYSWWVLSALSMLGRLHWIDADALARFILLCQDSDDGGIADKPGNQPDVYHTFFGAAGLSLLGWRDASAASDPPHALPAIDPTFAMPPETLQRLGIARRGLQSVEGAR
jgi:geranylgeranyl transferase type-2 subunit beta